LNRAIGQTLIEHLPLEMPRIRPLTPTRLRTTGSAVERGIDALWFSVPKYSGDAPDGMPCADYRLSNPTRYSTRNMHRKHCSSIVSKSQFGHDYSMRFISIKYGRHRTSYWCKTSPAARRKSLSKRPKVPVLQVLVHAPTQPGSGISGRQRPSDTYRYRAVPFFFFFYLKRSW
jgi:hypothetical protein